MLRILFQDDHFVAVHKPPGLLVHRTRISQDQEFLLQRLRKQLKQKLYPVHRLDRATAGVIVFALSSEAARLFSTLIQERQIRKIYLAIVRGYTPESGTIEHPLKKDGVGVLQEAVSHYRRLTTAELNIPVSRYPSARYSLVEVRPETGRMHQIRRHFNHLRHPILGDRKHGPRHHNRMWREQFQSEMLMLLAWKLEFKHPYSLAEVVLQTSPEPEMERMMTILNWEQKLLK